MSRPVLISLAGCAAVVIGGWLGAAERSAPVLSPDRSPSVSSEPVGPSTIEVHVAGWVISPGVVELSEGSLVVDAIEAAGGLRPGAVAHGINLAAAVLPGEQVFVPGPDQAGQAPSGGEGVVSVNRADAVELESLPGVGPVLAARIVAHREENGRFQAVEDLLDVPGIGESKLDALRDLITVP